MSDREKIELSIPKTYLENKNKFLWWIIRISREMIINSDIPGELKEFWNETPLNTVEIREMFWLSKQNFNNHIKSFKIFIEKEHWRKIVPLISWTNWSDVYTKWVIREFLSYMNRNGTKYKIEL